jgi:hypothetical protein
MVLFFEVEKLSPSRTPASTFHLDPPNSGAGVDPDIVGLVVAKRLANRESTAGGLEHELKLCQVAGVFRALDATSLDG